MNYPYPIPNQQGNTAYFYASSGGRLGSYSKPLEANTLITVDYGQLVPTIDPLSFSFRVKPGGSPQLLVGNVLLDASTVSFNLSGGIGGRAYEVTINSKLGFTDEIRSDVLTVNVQGDDCGCAPVIPTYPPGYSGGVSGDGSIIINTAPRFFVSGTPPVGANVLDRWYDTANGDIYDYVSNGIFTYWELATVGGGSSEVSPATILKINSIAPDGTTTLFTLTAVSGTPVNIVGSPSIFVSVDGVWQEPEVQFIAGGNQINFVNAPSADSAVFMVWFAAPTSPEISDGANIVKVELLTPVAPDGITTTFTLAATDGTGLAIAGANSLFVSVDGVWQEPTAQYVAALNMITFIDAPSADSNIFMLWFAPPPPTGP